MSPLETRMHLAHRLDPRAGGGASFPGAEIGLRLAGQPANVGRDFRNQSRAIDGFISGRGKGEVTHGRIDEPAVEALGQIVVRPGGAALLLNAAVDEIVDDLDAGGLDADPDAAGPILFRT